MGRIGTTTKLKFLSAKYYTSCVGAQLMAPVPTLLCARSKIFLLRGIARITPKAVHDETMLGTRGSHAPPSGVSLQVPGTVL